MTSLVNIIGAFLECGGKFIGRMAQLADSEETIADRSRLPITVGLVLLLFKIGYAANRFVHWHR